MNQKNTKNSAESFNLYVGKGNLVFKYEILVRPIKNNTGDIKYKFFYRHTK